MFGLMTPPVQDLNYRSVYSRCCQFQRRYYGIISLPLLSYDAIFLYLCSIDAGLVAESAIIPQTCCRFRREPSLDTAPDIDIGRFCGAISLILADTKFRDDLRDEGRLHSRLGRFVLAKPVERALKYFRGLDESFQALLEEWTADQVEVESNRRELTMEEFVKPTARAFAHIARMMPGAKGRIGFQDFLETLGKHLGVATVATDCALDWQEDLKTGNCNPVKNDFQAATTAHLAVSTLHEALDAIKVYLGPAARSADVARKVCWQIDKRLEEIYRAFYPPMAQPYADAYAQIKDAHLQPSCLCISLAEKVGARITPPQHEVLAGLNRKKRRECPKALQCTCQLISGVAPFSWMFGRSFTESNGYFTKNRISWYRKARLTGFRHLRIPRSAFEE